MSTISYYKQKIYYLLLLCGNIWKKRKKCGNHDHGCNVEDNENVDMVIDTGAPAKWTKVQDNLAKTPFPEFDLEGVPDGELTKVGNDETDSVQQQQQQQ